MTGLDEKEQNQEKIQYSIRFTPSVAEEIEEMTKEEGITKADFIRRALNFYQVKQRAQRENGKIYIITGKGEKIQVMM